MTLKENIMKLQTYKMFEGEDTLYVERDDVLKLLEQEPTGHWEWLTEDKYRCSICNSETRVDECLNEPMYEFCPFCGAKMVGDNNDR